MSRVLVVVFSLLLLSIIAGIAVVGSVMWHFGRDLPDYRQLADYQPPITTRLYAGDGRLITEYAVEKRVFVPVSAVPRRVVDAFLSAEDKNFYQHYGLDLTGLARAVIVNARNFGSDKRPVGASTITQQVAKNFLLTNEVSIERKIKEAILALRIEQAFSKDHILELYLNEIYLGYGSYGVAAAALNYFNKTLDQLTVAEAAYLAAVPKAPNNYHPVRKHAAALERRNWVIMRMLEDGNVSPEEATAALADPLETRARDETEYVQSADFFAEEVRRQIVARYGENSLYKGGLAVRTTLDPIYQHLAEKALHNGLIAYDRRHGWRGVLAELADPGAWKQVLGTFRPPLGTPEHWGLAAVLKVERERVVVGFADGSTGTVSFQSMKWTRAQSPGAIVKVGDIILVGETNRAHEYSLEQIPKVEGALVAMDPHTGRVLAMVGGFSSERSEFNRATQALRQPGSALKPFIYLAALESGFSPSTLIMDAPFVYDQGPGLPLWKPKNYSGQYYGPTTLRVGLEKSRNLMTIRLAQATGMDKVAHTAEIFGIDRKFPRNLASSLGAGETTVLRLTTAYAMLANGGKRITPTLIDRIQDRSGTTVYRHDTRPCPDCRDVFWTGQPMPEIPDYREQIADPRSVYQIVHILEGAVQYGTARRLAPLGVPMAGKTGTTNDSNDTWFVGFTPDLVVGAFVGFDEPKSLGQRETGASTALPIFHDFMKEALKGKPVRPFAVPRGIQLVRVDHRSGRLAMPGDSDVVQEAFKVGNSPGFTTGAVVDGSAAMAESVESQDDAVITDEDALLGPADVYREPADSAKRPPPRQDGQPRAGGLY
ncbi:MULTISPECIES: penicillin-binding protein 1A [unclassified Haematospirillum]|uniref:penicillin-binding protein 1A n=1 Tax=unclassified Haematospirillum TaxID=2622088 RepID=UPI00143B164D|nr:MULTISPECIES: penicillin-binding protein 1A [unclassified Haematospirillum]NKD54780.1 penicillin-binding protein 1A [Haematospirillum sp. H4890]NKD74618.1 penicillin-binding protein 1A [Haematospirillum sp. H4485]